jgi:hypothetical protein
VPLKLNQLVADDRRRSLLLCFLGRRAAGLLFNERPTALLPLFSRRVPKSTNLISTQNDRNDHRSGKNRK